MDRHDRELLDRQMRHLDPPPSNSGTALLGVAAAFLAGVTLGGYVVAYTSEPPQMASTDVAAVVEQPSPTLPVAH
jgi:hypothetical protein